MLVIWLYTQKMDININLKPLNTQAHKGPLRPYMALKFYLLVHSFENYIYVQLCIYNYIQKRTGLLIKQCCKRVVSFVPICVSVGCSVSHYAGLLQLLDLLIALLCDCAAMLTRNRHCRPPFLLSCCHSFDWPSQ